MNSDELGKALEATLELLKPITERFEVIEASLQKLMDGDRNLMSTDLKLQDRIAAIENRMTELLELIN